MTSRGENPTPNPRNRLLVPRSPLARATADAVDSLAMRGQAWTRRDVERDSDFGEEVNLRPITFKEACAFVATHHRHHKPPQGHKFSIGVEENGELVGVAIAGRPIARMSDDGFTLEIIRLATNGQKNACSMLYRAAARAGAAMGYKKVLTYTLESENGSSLRGAGFKNKGTTSGGSWSRPSRARENNHPLDRKQRWQLDMFEIAPTDSSPQSSKGE